MRYAGLFVAVAVIAAYSNCFSGAFQMDDGLRILRNPSLRSPLSAIQGTTRPLVGLTLWLNLAMGGRVADFHLFNLAVHLVATLLLYGIIRRTCRTRGCTEETSTGLAVVGAALWGVHPIQTQSVTYIIQRAESMMGMFALLTLYAFVRAIASARPRKWLVLSVVACALGMLSKPVMLVVPMVVLLFDRVVGQKTGSRGYYAALFGTMVIGVALVFMPNESSTTAGMSVGLLSPGRYLLTQFGVIVHYLKLIVWPRGLCLDYAWPGASGIGEVWWQALVVCGLIAAAVIGVRKRSVAGFGLAAFLVLLIPTSSVIPVADAAMEHRLYLPLAGLIVCGGALAIRLRGAYGVTSWALVKGNFALRVLGGVVVAVLAFLTYQRNMDYHSIERMARDTVAKRPDNFRARATLVMALLDGEKFTEGEAEAREMVTRLEKGIAQGGAFSEVGGMNAEGYYPVGLNQLGRALLCLGRFADAVPHFDRALEARPDHKEAWLNKSIALYELGDRTGSQKAVEEALKIDPAYGKAVQMKSVLGGRNE